MNIAPSEDEICCAERLQANARAVPVIAAIRLRADSLEVLLAVETLLDFLAADTALIER